MPSEDIGTDETVLALPVAPQAPLVAARRPAMLFPAAIPPTTQRRRRPWWIFGLVGIIVAGLAVAIAGATYAMRASARVADERAADPSTVLAPAPPPRPAPPTAGTPEALVTLEHTALAHADTAALVALFAPDAFAIGRDADQLAFNPQAAADAISNSLGAGRDRLSSRSLHIGRAGDDIAWIANELEAAGTRFASTQLARRDANGWHILAWHFAERVSNRRAYALAADGALPAPLALRDRGDEPLRTAFRTAFSSRKAFIEAVAPREDAVDLGSAPGERIAGGDRIARAFGKLTADFTIHDGVAAGRATAHAGWAAANVDYVLRDGTAQTYRVLAIFVDDRLVLAHWSNGGPL